MRFFLLLLIVILVGGCGRIPEPVGYEYSTQQKMQAAHHWDVLAGDLANRINNELIRSDFLDTAVFVEQTCGNDSEPCRQDETTQFDEGFRDLLITKLVDFGIPTSTVPDREAITVKYKVQLVQHRTRRLRTVQPGVITMLSATIAVLRNAPMEVIGIALGGGLDYANNAYAKKSEFETIITTSMVFRKKYFFRSSDIYYINAADHHHYRKQNATTHEIELTSSQEM